MAKGNTFFGGGFKPYTGNLTKSSKSAGKPKKAGMGKGKGK